MGLTINKVGTLRIGLSGRVRNDKDGWIQKGKILKREIEPFTGNSARLGGVGRPKGSEMDDGAKTGAEIDWIKE